MQYRIVIRRNVHRGRHQVHSGGAARGSGGISPQSIESAMPRANDRACAAERSARTNQEVTSRVKLAELPPVP
jgi:hypothetical protein